MSSLLCVHVRKSRWGINIEVGRWTDRLWVYGGRDRYFTR